MILELLKKRSSVRIFQDKQVSSETIDYILEAGRLSPSGGNEQPWEFGVITDKDLIKTISKLAYNQTWIETAPFLVVLCTIVVDKERGGRDIQKVRFPKYKQLIDEMDDEIYTRLHMEEHQTKIPGTHMVLAALEHGIGSTWISYFEVDRVTELLNLSGGCIPSEILAFGYPANDFKPRKKKAIEDIVFKNRMK